MRKRKGSKGLLLAARTLKDAWPGSCQSALPLVLVVLSIVCAMLLEVVGACRVMSDVRCLKSNAGFLLVES